MCQTPPKTLVEAVRYFGDEDRAHDCLVGMRWPTGVCCPRCGSVKVRYISTRKRWRCNDCIVGKQFSVRVGTIFEDSKLKIGDWMVVIWMLLNTKNGTSSYEIARHLGITQKSAWFAMHRARLALHAGSFDRQLCGRVEIDETFIGGRARNMHAGKRKAKGSGAVGKAVVMGLLERHGEVRTVVVPTTRRAHLNTHIDAHVEAGSEVFTDALKSYAHLHQKYAHEVIDHAECYAKGHVHTNGLENYSSLLKRTIKGTYVAIEPFHLFRYLDEQTFRFNARKGTDGERFDTAVRGVNGKRLTYKALIGENAPEGCSASGGDAGSVGRMG